MSTKTQSTETELVPEMVQLVEVKRCRPRGVNRVDLELDDEFKADIAANGVTTPILVRPISVSGQFEIIKGHRRWSASVSVSLATIPAIVRPMTDKEAGEEQLRDCLLAKNLKPLDEARLYQERLASSDYGQGKDAVSALAGAIHVSLSTLYARLRLLKLPEGAQEALKAGAIEASVADLVATIPDAKQQAKFLTEVVSHRQWSEQTGKQEKAPMSFRQAKELIVQYRVDLKGAPFDTADPSLAGEPSCGECPRRSGNIPGLPSGSPPNVCTLPTCYERKCAAFHQRLAKFGLKKKTAAIHSASPKQKAADKADEARARFEVQQIVEACMKVVENPKLDDHRHALLWHFVVRQVFSNRGGDIAHILERRKIHAVNFEREIQDEAVDPKRELSLRFCRGHALELLLSSEYQAQYDEDALADLAKLCGVGIKVACGGAHYVLVKPNWTAVPDGKAKPAAKPAAAKPAKTAKAAKGGKAK
jgi:ParB/RepB/Spo0J family partition protein